MKNVWMTFNNTSNWKYMCVKETITNNILKSYDIKVLSRKYTISSLVKL